VRADEGRFVVIGTEYQIEKTINSMDKEIDINSKLQQRESCRERLFESKVWEFVREKVLNEEYKPRRVFCV